MTKKITKYLIINITIILAILLASDYVYFKYIEYNYRQNCIQNNITIDKNVKYKTYKIQSNKDRTTTNIYKYFLDEKHYHSPMFPSENSNKEPIILFGCSYTWLHNNEGLQKLLMEYTNRPIFNFAYWGWGAQHMYYLINNPLLYKIISSYETKQPKYVLYVYIRDHKNRITDIMDYFLDNEPYLNYQNKNGKLEIKKYNYFHKNLYRLFSYRYLKKKLNKENTDKYKYEMLFKLIDASHKAIKKQYPNIKFIMLEYYQENYEINEEKEFFEKIKNSGITIISTKDITKEDLFEKKYTQDDGYHPHPNAWQVITKPLAKKIESI